MLEVVEPGLLSTVQDRGRPGLGHLGVPPSGACDRLGLAVANLLVGNAPGEAALEITLVGPSLTVARDCLIGLGGADLGALVESPSGAAHPFPVGTSRRIERGSSITFDDGRGGCRTYLALPSGFDVPEILGSRSTCLPGAFGGLDGRALLPGDRLRSRADGSTGAGRAWPSALPPGGQPGRGPIRVLPGPHPARFPGDALARFLAADWIVSSRSDRVALRLEPVGQPVLPLPDAAAMASQPLVWGAIQLPPDGRPTIHLADHRTVGGYPVIGVVPTVDHPRIGQLAPADRVRFVPSSLDACRLAARELDEMVDRVGRQLGAPLPGTDAAPAL